MDQEMERKKAEAPVVPPTAQPSEPAQTQEEDGRGRPGMDDTERNSDPLKSQTGKQPKPSNPEGSL